VVDEVRMTRLEGYDQVCYTIRVDNLELLYTLKMHLWIQFRIKSSSYTTS